MPVGCVVCLRMYMYVEKSCRERSEVDNGKLTCEQVRGKIIRTRKSDEPWLATLRCEGQLQQPRLNTQTSVGDF